MLRLVALVLLLVFYHTAAFAWSPAGHHVAAVVAYEFLSVQDRETVMDIIAAHPDFNRYFKPPQGMVDAGSIDRWRIGVAGCWPDIIRGSEEDRPSWHYQLGANYVIGNVRTPQKPGPLPKQATMATTDLYIAQAVELCERVFADVSRPKSERAIALCWLLHLYADGHQPCHAGSLYAPAMPDGDRGANFLKLQDGGNLHAAWDRLLGDEADANDVRRRVVEFGDVKAKMREEAMAAGVDHWLKTSTWLDESVQLAHTHLYTDEVTGPVIAASRRLTERVEPLNLSDAYFRAAGKAARHRIQQAGVRVAIVIGHSLDN